MPSSDQSHQEVLDGYSKFASVKPVFVQYQIRSYFLLILFLFGALVPGQAQEELAQVPVLWRHFQLHKSQHPPISFAGFLRLHYGEDFALHRTAHDHSKLPMKSGDNHLHAPVPVDFQKPVELTFQTVISGSQPIAFKDQAAPQSFLHEIWQPPRSC